MRWVGHVERGKRNVCRLLEGNIEGKRPLGRSRHGGRIIFRLIFLEIECGLDWSGSG
jgi:hypothetical protein